MDDLGVGNSYPALQASQEAQQLPGGQLVCHHDVVVCVGHQQPDGVLQDVLNELFAFLRVCSHFRFVIIL